MTLYNEIERFAVPWLWELMNAKEISSGTVDTTDIRQLRAGHLADYERVHLFAGIGGWDYALAACRVARLRASVDRELPLWTVQHRRSSARNR